MTGWRRNCGKVNNQILSTLSLCRRAGRLVWGFDAVGRTVADGTAEVVAIASDASLKTQKEVLYLCRGGTPVVDIGAGINEIWYAIGKKCAVLAVTDAGLARKLVGIALPFQGGVDKI